ncbi:MAG: response regulator [Dorea sp.]|nr:response regulator [Dorea sp.]
MSLYSVLMVDDEEEVIRIIRRKINWEELGFQVCGQARNGLEALEMIEELQPDVVMTDIKMPYMDGLELARRVKELNLGIHMIILSGFDEFDYVKQAISLEVDEYLLKPIDSSEIIKVFGKVKKSIDDERNMKNNVAYLENYYQQSLPILREGFLSSLMEHSISEDRMQNYMQEYDVKLTGPYYVVVDVHTSVSNLPEGISGRLLPMSVRQLLENSSLNQEDRYIFNYRDNLVLLAQFKNQEEISRFTDACNRFCKLAKKSTQAIVSIGVGKPVTQIKDLMLSYNGARNALSYRALYGAGNAINITELEFEENSYDGQENTQFHEIFKQIRMGSEERVKEEVEIYVHGLLDANLNIQSYTIVLMELITNYYHFIKTNGLDLSLILGENEDLYYRLMHMDSMEEVKDWILQTSLKLRSNMQSQRITKSNSIVLQAQAYLKENYTNPDLSIDLICSELGVSAAYFSTVFKKESGKTFLNYLTEIRMEEAGRLLTETDEKTYVIAERVGFSDPGYFSYVFKKWFGVTPLKYKKQGK